MRLSKEDYKKANDCLKRYNYNYINILNMKMDIMNISGVNIDGMPKAKFKISNPVLNSVIQLQEDKQLQKSILEYRAVVQALALVNEDSNIIFEELYVKNKRKWDIICERGMSERTYFRRKTELIQAVHKELKKLA